MTNIIYFDESSEDNDFLLGAAEQVVKLCGIRVSSYEEMMFGAVSDFNLVGVLVAGAPQGDPWKEMRFSVCVHPDHRRQGIARQLIKAFLEHCAQDDFPPSALVVNPAAMEPLLEQLGFHCDNADSIWTSKSL